MFVSASAPDRPDPGNNTEEKRQLTDRLLWRDDSDRARDQSARARLLVGQLPDALAPVGFLSRGNPFGVFGACWEFPLGQQMTFDGAGQECLKQTRCDHASPIFVRQL
jgi:hypothetical protein